MFQKSIFLLSGVSVAGTGDLSMGGVDRFTVQLNGSNFDSNPSSTGKFDIRARVDENMPFTNIGSTTFNSASGTIFTYEYPIQALRIVLNNANPTPSGVFTAAVRCAWEKGN